MDMPVGEPIYFEGDISQFEDISNKLGFFELEIIPCVNLIRKVPLNIINNVGEY